MAMAKKKERRRKKCKTSLDSIKLRTANNVRASTIHIKGLQIQKMKSRLIYTYFTGVGKTRFLSL